MAVKTRRKYVGNAAQTTLSATLNSGATTTTLAAATGWPASGPFYAVVDPGTAGEEKILVGTISGTSLSSITRGVDGTTEASHAIGATIYPVFTAIDADEANELTSTYANQGGIVYQGASTFTQLAIGTAGHVLKVNSGATAPEWGQVAAAGIASDAVTTAKILDSNVTTAKIADSNVTTAKLATDAVTTAKIADDAVTLAKLAPAATPGLVHLNTTTFSGVTSQAVNSVFSSTYSSYRIIISNVTYSSAIDYEVRFQLSQSGTPGGSYSWALKELDTYATEQNKTGNSDSSLLVAYGYSAEPSFIEIDVDTPATGTKGSRFFVRSASDTSSSTYRVLQGMAIQSSNYNADGFVISKSGAGNISGTITVYGYLK